MTDKICNRLFAAAPLVMFFAVFAAIGCTPSRETKKEPNVDTTTVYVPVYKTTDPPPAYRAKPKRGNPIQEYNSIRIHGDGSTLQPIVK